MKKKKNKVLKNVIISSAAVLAVGAIGTGLVLHYTNKNTGKPTPDTSITVKPDAGSDAQIDINKTYTSAQYLAMVNQYTQEIEGLKSELTNSQEQYNQSLATYQAEITSLQQEIETLGEENAEQINEKNARIETIKAYIKTLEDEQSEKNADYEKQISKLNSLLSNYENEILKTINLPSDFIFTSLGFQVIENNDFVFYSTSHSCKLYYYHFDSETLETIPIKGTSFNAFYKLNNALYFVTSQMLYMYDFSTKEITILGSAPTNLVYSYDANNLYVFDGSGGYAVLNFATKKLENYFLFTRSSTINVPIKLDNYILRMSYGPDKTKNSITWGIRCFNTVTQTDTVVLENCSVLNSFIKTDDGYFFAGSNGFYKLDTLTMSVEKIQDFVHSYTRCYAIENKVVIFAYQGAYIYENSTMTKLVSYGNNECIPNFIKISDGLYYVVNRNSDNIFSGLWKLDLTNKTFTQLSSTYGYSNIYNNVLDVAHYKVVAMIKGMHIIDSNTGTVESCALTNSSGFTPRFSLKSIDCGNYTIIYVSNYSENCDIYVYYYDKTNDVFGKLYNGTLFSKTEISYKNGILYVMSGSYLYTFNLAVSRDNCVDKIAIDSSLSNLQAGVFYSQVATLQDSKLYIKYTLLDDGTFDKELVVI